MARLRAGEKNKRPTIEWVIGAASAILILMLLGYLFVQGVVRQPERAALTVRVVSVEHLQVNHVARVEVHNSGDEAASAVMVEASAAGQPTVSIEFDYVAGKGARHGAFYFA